MAMARSKYGKYFMTEPIEIGPMLHVCGEEGCIGAKFDGFPIEMQLLCLSKPGVMIHKPHAHEVDELFFIFGGNPQNYFEFGAEIEIMTLEEQIAELTGPDQALFGHAQGRGQEGEPGTRLIRAGSGPGRGLRDDRPGSGVPVRRQATPTCRTTGGRPTRHFAARLLRAGR